MSQLDDLIARSRAPGHFVERRRFTLSRDKAIEKQREFALRHPKQYIPELIQAAVFCGATYIAIDARPHSVLVAWVGGRRIEDKELENLLDYLFADRGDERYRHLVQLAVGVNAILQRKPFPLDNLPSSSHKPMHRNTTILRSDTRRNLGQRNSQKVPTRSDNVLLSY